MFPHFADFAANGNGDSFGFQLTDIAGQLHPHLEIQPLFFLYIGLAEVHEGGSVYVNIVKTRVDPLTDEVFQAVDLFIRVQGEIFSVDLFMTELLKNPSQAAELGRNGVALVTARYNWTPGKFRLWVGGGAGLWANLWREVVEAEYVNLTCIPAVEPGCDPKTEFRESQGDRRTIIPLSVSVGVTWQFLPHWSVHLEDRFLFLADSNVTLFESESDYDLGGNQVMLGFSYKL